jgi:phosphoribosyl-dephospho-CoA transferase
VAQPSWALIEMTGTAIAGRRLDVDTEELAASCLSRSAVPASNRACTLKETTCDAARGRKAQGAGCYPKTHSSSKSS